MIRRWIYEFTLFQRWIWTFPEISMILWWDSLGAQPNSLEKFELFDLKSMNTTQFAEVFHYLWKYGA